MSVSTEVDILEATMEFNVEIYVGMNMGTTWRKILIEMWKYKMNEKKAHYQTAISTFRCVTSEVKLFAILERMLGLRLTLRPFLLSFGPVFTSSLLACLQV